jgi:hypothetical protein
MAQTSGLLAWYLIINRSTRGAGRALFELRSERSEAEFFIVGLRRTFFNDRRGLPYERLPIDVATGSTGYGLRK